MEHDLLLEIIALLSFSVLAVLILRRIHLPPVIGYLLIGVIAGPYVGGVLQESHVMHLLGEIGIVFLLFTIGLEFTINQLVAMRGTVIRIGIPQVIIGVFSGSLIALFFGLRWEAAVVVGGALAMSSTAICIKQLTDQSEIHSRHGRLVVGTLLLQDLAAIPFLIAIPLLAESNSGSLAVIFASSAAKAVVAVAVMLVIGRRIISRLLDEVSKAHSVEVFTLAVLLIALSSAWVTDKVGLSFVLGAFLAGMVLSESVHKKLIESELRPFKDVLLGLFFVTVGMKMNPAVLPDIWLWVFITTIGLILGKGILIILLAKLSGHETGVAIRTGVSLGQGGEFGFALIALALTHGVINTEETQPVLAGIILSMFIAPILIRFNGALAKRLPFGRYEEERIEREQHLADEFSDIHDHVVLCGFGHTGQIVADILAQRGIQFLAVDSDSEKVNQSDARVLCGDASHDEVLNGLNLKRARAMVIAVKDLPSELKIIHHVRALQPDLPILVRALDQSDADLLFEAGATEVLPTGFEESPLMATELNALLKTSDQTSSLGNL